MIIRALILYTIVLGFTACSVYRSPDRDFFDDNGRSGAPTTHKPTTSSEFDAHPEMANGDLTHQNP